MGVHNWYLRKEQTIMTYQSATPKRPLAHCKVAHYPTTANAHWTRHQPLLHLYLFLNSSEKPKNLFIFFSVSEYWVCSMARKKIREYDSKRLLKQHLKRLSGIDLQIRSAQVWITMLFMFPPASPMLNSVFLNPCLLDFYFYFRFMWKDCDFCCFFFLKVLFSIKCMMGNLGIWWSLLKLYHGFVVGIFKNSSLFSALTFMH